MPIQRYRKYQGRVFWPKSKAADAHLSMAVKAGGFVFLRGQTGFDFEGKFHGVGDATAQTEQACKCIKILLEEAGAKMRDVCRITVYYTDRAWREQVWGVLAKHFRNVYPCATGLVVAGLALPEMMVEIDVVAYTGK